MNGDFSFLKGNINTIILCSLYSKDGKSGDKYGYEIAKEIKERTENRYEIKQPTLYAYLKKLEQQDLIGSYWGTESNGGRRRYYTLTPKGRRDCEQFMAEWEYHKSVLSTLVDSSNTPIEVSQDQVTPLFGEKTKRAKTANAFNSKEFNEQDEISRRLDALIAADSGKTSIPSTEQENPSKPVQESLFDSLVEEPALPNKSDATDDDLGVVFETVQEKALPAEEPTTSSSTYANFEVNQDNADEFMQQFEERARVISESLEAKPAANENYQHILMKVIGDQLDDMRDFDNEQTESSQKYYTDHPVALEEVAENLARQGIRLRIYNHASSHFKSKTLMPVSNVLCKTAWLTFAVAAIYFGILMLTSIAVDNWKPFLITLCVVSLLPIATTVYALYDPSRKEKPRFLFKRILIATSIMALFVILLSLGISILNRIELGDFAAVGTQILIPTGIAILLPIFTVVFNYFYKKY